MAVTPARANPADANSAATSRMEARDMPHVIVPEQLSSAALTFSPNRLPAWGHR